jgi:hypothetical protein
MAKTRMSARQAGPQKRSNRVNLASLDKLIAEATVDGYNESEQITGIFTMLEENLAVPFKTTLLGMEVTVERIDMNDANDIVAVCRRGGKRQRIRAIAGREPASWNQVKDLIATKQPKGYDHAVKLLLDLAARKGKRDDFEARLDGLRAAHTRKPSFIDRLRRAKR